MDDLNQNPDGFPSPQENSASPAGALPPLTENPSLPAPETGSPSPSLPEASPPLRPPPQIPDADPDTNTAEKVDSPQETPGQNISSGESTPPPVIPPGPTPETYVVKASPPPQSFPLLAGKAPLVFLAGLLLVAATMGGLFLVQKNQAPKKAAEGDLCLYCENCEGSASKYHQCTGTKVNEVCKYNPAVPPNCSSCLACGDGTCSNCEDTSNCPQDCISTNPNCPSGKEAGMGGFTNPNPDCETTSGGIFCHDSTKAYCCYDQNGDPSDGYEYCAEGQQGNCLDLGNGSICVKNDWSGTIFKIVGNDVSCPFYGQDTPVFSGTVSGGTTDCGTFTGQVFSLDVDECGQIDGPCGSCRPGCPLTEPTPTNIPLPTPTQGVITLTPSPTNTPLPNLTPTNTPFIPIPTPTNTPIPTVTNTPIPTPTTAPYCVCALARIYDLSWNYVDPSTVRFGTSYYFGVLASYESVQSARFRINQTASASWCGTAGSPGRVVSGWCETTTKRPNSNEYYIKYQIPHAGGQFSVQAEVACPTGWK